MMNFVHLYHFPTYYEYRNKQFEVIYTPGIPNGYMQGQASNFAKHNGQPNGVWRSHLACNRNGYETIKFLHKKHFYKRIQKEKRLEGLSNIFFKHDNRYLPGVIYRLHYTTLDGYTKYECIIGNYYRRPGQILWENNLSPTNFHERGFEQIFNIDELKAQLL